MKRFLYLLIGALSLTACNAIAQTNILCTNPIAEQVLLGNYDPATYSASTIINQPGIISSGINSQVSPDSLHSYLETLRSFKNRNTGSDTISSTKGIGAARKWAYNKFQQFNIQNENRLITTYLQFDMPVCGTDRHKNILAVLPGSDTSDKSIVIMEAHIDSRCADVCDTACLAEGMEDNGSGTALILELARVMSKYTYNHTIVFMLVIGEEQGLIGAEAFADYVQAKGIKVKAVLNNDVIGGIICGQTSSPPSCPGLNNIDSTNVRLFSFANFNSPHKQLARYVKLEYKEMIKPIATVPMDIHIMTPEDRTGRGGDHIPFRQHGYNAIRFTSANEHGDADVSAPGYSDRQHTSADILGVDINNDQVIDNFFVDFDYLARNTVINGNAAAMAAISPQTPINFTLTSSGNTLILSITQPMYNIYRIGVRSNTNDWDTVYTFTGTSYSFSLPNGIYAISVAAVDNNDVESLFSEEKTSVIADINDPSQRINAVELLQNKPNPFDEATTISIMVNKVPAYKTAYITITDAASGKEIKRQQIQLKKGINEITYEHGYHATGILIYSLVVDNKIVQSRRMIFSN